MQKAKSRLKSKPTPKATIIKQRLGGPSPALLKKYLHHLPLLFLSLLFYSGVYFILSKINPEKIRHFLIPNTYLPLQLTLFLGNFFFFSYLFLKTKLGLKLSLVIASALFFKLQAIDNYWLPTLIVSGLVLSSCIFDRLSYRSR